MGVSKTTAFLLREMSRQGFLGGELLQLGVQRISPDAKALVKSFSASAASKSRTKANSSMRQFWINLGFNSVCSLDNSDFEGAEIVWDLNLPIKDSFVEQFDAVFNGGTMEHVFNTPCVLENISRLLKVGGIAIHEVPSSNGVDHGFYSFSPTLFRDYYLNLGYELIEVLLIVKKGHKAKVYEYFPRDKNTEIPENWKNKTVNVWCVARKKFQIGGADAPQQAKYLDAWSKGDQTRTADSGLWQISRIFKRKARAAVVLMSKKSAILAVLLGLLSTKPKRKVPLLLKYEVKSKKNGDFV